MTSDDEIKKRNYLVLVDDDGDISTFQASLSKSEANTIAKMYRVHDIKPMDEEPERVTFSELMDMELNVDHD